MLNGTTYWKKKICYMLTLHIIEMKNVNQGSCQRLLNRIYYQTTFHAHALATIADFKISVHADSLSHALDVNVLYRTNVKLIYCSEIYFIQCKNVF